MLSTLILSFCSISVFSQKKLSGDLNQPNAHVITISGPDRVIVDNASGFSVNDTILIIQMQGVEILTGVSDFGNINGMLGEPGMHEFMIVQSVNVVSGLIIFRNDFLKTYDSRGNVQIVRVPYYNSATVTGTLFCKPWDGNKGGVLALIIGRTLKLEADIDVSDRGFRGALDVVGDNRCSQTAPLTLNPTYPAGFPNAGLKGEGVANYDEFGVLLDPNNVKGKGSNFTGGGGGNGQFSGGGGGSNRGAGGTGGYEDNTCLPPQPGGKGGIKSESLSFPSLLDRIYLGGGGGASTSLTGLSQPGGNGGGIVIIVTDTLIGNSHKIVSNGANGGLAVVNGGSGGGGAGGSVALSLRSYGASTLTVSVSGGNGGDNPGTFGEGGGGGGGLFYVNTTPTADVQVLKDGGKQGNFLDPPSTPAEPGLPGETKPGFKAILNGFLFNSVRSSVTGDTLDWICSNVIPKLLTGTLPVGGSGNYTYRWQKSYNTSVPAGTIDIPSSNTLNYLPTALESTTVYFRRIVTDNISLLEDISKWVKIIVQPAISGNNIGKDTTICQGQNPVPIGSVPANADPLGGTGIFRYKWLQNVNNSGWDTLQVATGSPNNLKSFDPAALNQPTFYKRYAKSGRCIDLSNSVKINVLNSIKGNILARPDSVICQGLSFATLTASTPVDGEPNVYRYQWEDSIATSVWNPAAGINTGTTYIPDTSKFTVSTQNRFYRRVVLSGPFDVCKSKSSPILLTKYPKIKNNLITANPADLIICSGSVPVVLPGSAPVDGAGTGSYTYLWRQSTNGTSFEDATGVNNSTTGNYQAPALTDTTWYQRIVNSGVYKGSPVCTNTSKPVILNVHKPILNNIIALSGGGTLQTICNNQAPLSIQATTPTGGTNNPLDFTYLWKYSTDNVIFNTVPGVATTVDYSPDTLNVSTSFRRDASSGACTVSSNTIAVTVLQSIANNTLSGTPRVCSGSVPDQVTGATPSGGSGSYTYLWHESTDGGTKWTLAAGANTSSNYQPPLLFAPTSYRRTVSSGLNNCCTSESNIFDIAIDPLPVTKINAGPDTIIYSVERIYHMKAVNPAPAGETGEWSVLNNGTGNPEQITSYNTLVNSLSVGTNSFLWTVSKGNCNLKDSVNIVLLNDFEPEGFSPNGDAWNNTFIIEGLDENDNYLDLSIINGAGTEVFSATNRNGQKWTNWDGKNSKGLDLAEGTYYYLLKITPKTLTGSSIKKNGFVILKRY